MSTVHLFRFWALKGGAVPDIAVAVCPLAEPEGAVCLFFAGGARAVPRQGMGSPQAVRWDELPSLTRIGGERRL